jgi:LAGLIDADG DNA endonuclease family protein
MIKDLIPTSLASLSIPPLKGSNDSIIQKNNLTKFELNNTKLPDVNKEWLDWFVGFTDGEGSFSIVELKNKNFRFFFRIRLHKDDIKVLIEISNTLGLMPPFLDGNSAVLQVTDFQKITNIIIPIFVNMPLLTKKASDFKKFLKAVEIKSNTQKNHSSDVADLESNYLAIMELKNSMNSLNLNKDYLFNTNANESQQILISPNWLLGFVEGEGTFGYKNLVPYFQISQHSRDTDLLNLIKIFLESLRPLPNSPIKNLKPVVNKIINKRTKVLSYTITDLDVLYHIIVPFFLSLQFKTRKLIDYNLWVTAIKLHIFGYYLLPTP